MEVDEGAAPFGTPTIERATTDDAAEILALQKLAYQSEARLYDDWGIAPLTQTLAELREEMQRKVVLKVVERARILGSVRGERRDGTGHIERLIVDPAWQGRGIGTRLMREIESALAPVERYELFTGHLSVRNITLYERLGYRQCKRERVHAHLELVHLRKQATEH